MKKRLLALVLAGIMVCTQAACGQQEEAPATEPVQEEVVEEPEELEAVLETEEEEVVGERGIEPAPAGMGMNLMTGEFIDADLAAQRPFALMVPCDKTCYPHYGVSTADVIYEASCRGDHGFPRTMYIWQDYSGMSRMGNTRSARTYYAVWSKEYDALFGHYGQSPFANPTLATMDDMDALGIDVGANSSPALDSIMFFRSSDHESPHNAYTSSEGIQKAIEKYNYRTQKNPGYEAHFRFAWTGESVDLENGYDATVIKPGFTTVSARFDYNPDDGLYYRSTWGAADKDALNGKQIAVKNIFLQKVSYKLYTTDDEQFAGLRSNAAHWNGEKYLNIDTVSGGEGIYITNGKAIDVTWAKKGADVDGLPTLFYDKATGEEITVNKGKTWFCIILDDRWDQVEINDEKPNAPSADSAVESSGTTTEEPKTEAPAETKTEEKPAETPAAAPADTPAPAETPAQTAPTATEAAPAAPAPAATEAPAPAPAPAPAEDAGAGMAEM